MCRTSEFHQERFGYISDNSSYKGPRGRLECRLILARTRFRQFVGQRSVTRVEFQCPLISTSGTLFLFGFHVTVTQPFKSKDAGQLLALSLAGKLRRALVSTLGISQPVHAQVSTG